MNSSGLRLHGYQCNPLHRLRVCVDSVDSADSAGSVDTVDTVDPVDSIDSIGSVEYRRKAG